jgi:hypothetical protein
MGHVVGWELSSKLLSGFRTYSDTKLSRAIYRAKNKSKIAEYNRQYRVKNKDRLSALACRDKEKLREYAKQYRELHREERRRWEVLYRLRHRRKPVNKDTTRQYSLRNKEKMSAYRRQYYEKKRKDWKLYNKDSLNRRRNEIVKRIGADPSIKVLPVILLMTLRRCLKICCLFRKRKTGTRSHRKKYGNSLACNHTQLTYLCKT